MPRKMRLSDIATLIAMSPTPTLAARRVVIALATVERKLRREQCAAMQDSGMCIYGDYPDRQPCATCPQAMESVFDVIEKGVNG